MTSKEEKANDFAPPPMRCHVGNEVFTDVDTTPNGVIAPYVKACGSICIYPHTEWSVRSAIDRSEAGPHSQDDIFFFEECGYDRHAADSLCCLN